MWQLGQRCSPKSPTLQLLSLLALLPPLRWHKIYTLNLVGHHFTNQYPIDHEQTIKNGKCILFFFMNISVFIDTATVGSNRQAVRTAAKSILDDLGDNRQVKQKKHISNGSPHGSLCTKTTPPATRPDIATAVGSLSGSRVS